MESAPRFLTLANAWTILHSGETEYHAGIIFEGGKKEQKKAGALPIGQAQRDSIVYLV